MPDASAKSIEPAVLALLRCPVTRSALTQQGDWLVADEPEGAGLRYPIREGIPVLLMDQATLPAGVGSLDEFKQQYADAIASEV